MWAFLDPDPRLHGHLSTTAPTGTPASACCLICADYPRAQLVPGSAAANSPVETGEVIAAVNGVDCSLCSTDQLAELLLGPEGSVVSLQTISTGGKLRAVNLERGAPVLDDHPLVQVSARRAARLGAKEETSWCAL
jgi:hypothetical protein